MTQHPVIGLSGKARHGKNMVATILTEELARYQIVARQIGFADAVKREATELHGWNGQKDETGRTLLQKIGTDRRREDPLYWVKACFQFIDRCDEIRAEQEKMDKTPETHNVWIITDVRFINESDYIREHGGVVWRIVRLNLDYSMFRNDLTPEQQLHPSEIELDSYQDFDALIANRDTNDLRTTLSDLAFVYIYKKLGKE